MDLPNPEKPDDVEKKGKQIMIEIVGASIPNINIYAAKELWLLDGAIHSSKVNGNTTFSEEIIQMILDVISKKRFSYTGQPLTLRFFTSETSIKIYLGQRSGIVEITDCLTNNPVEEWRVENIIGEFKKYVQSILWYMRGYKGKVDIQSLAEETASRGEVSAWLSQNINRDSLEGISEDELLQVLNNYVVEGLKFLGAMFYKEDEPLFRLVVRKVLSNILWGVGNLKDSKLDPSSNEAFAEDFCRHYFITTTELDPDEYEQYPDEDYKLPQKRMMNLLGNQQYLYARFLYLLNSAVNFTIDYRQRKLGFNGESRDNFGDDSNLVEL
jgi:hypothetical protein